jgi:hypothetical protein
MYKFKSEPGQFERVGFSVFSMTHAIRINLLFCTVQDAVHVDQPITNLIITWKEHSTLACRGFRPRVPPASQMLDVC